MVMCQGYELLIEIFESSDNPKVQPRFENYSQHLGLTSYQDGLSVAPQLD